MRSSSVTPGERDWARNLISSDWLLNNLFQQRLEIVQATAPSYRVSGNVVFDADGRFVSADSIEMVVPAGIVQIDVRIDLRYEELNAFVSKELGLV